MKKNVVFIKSKRLDTLVNGGDGSHSHVLALSEGSAGLIPAISNKKVDMGFYLLTLVCGFGGAYSLYNEDIFDGALLLALAWIFALFRKKGKGAGIVTLETTLRLLTKRNKGLHLTVDFDDIEHIEIINKVKTGGNGYFIKTSELNVSLKNGERENLATGGDIDIIIAQATALAEIIGCDVHHDDYH
ncbi:MAG: hypothetical protein ACI9TY_000801 [Alphaproteobacteria bacterium]|jgi:hypothetical protein